MKNALSVLLKLRQISNDPSLVLKKRSLKFGLQNSPKIQQVLNDLQEHLKTTPDGKVVIYTNFKWK